MTTIEELTAIANTLLSKQTKRSQHLKHEIDNKLNTINNQTNGQIYELWNELEFLFLQNKDTPPGKPHATSITTKNKSQRSRKRRYGQRIQNNASESHGTEPPTKRKKTNRSTSNNLRMRASSSSSIASSTKKHRKLTIRTTSNTPTSTEQTPSNLPSNDDNEHYLYHMLRNAQKAKQLTQNNIDLLQKCIDDIDVFEDGLEANIMELGDQIRNTFQEFPFKNVTPSFHHKMLQEQLRFNRMVSKYPDLEQTEQDVYKLQSHYVSKYTIPSSERESQSESVKGKEEATESDIDDDALLQSDEKDSTSCVCKQPSNGNMIRCENKACVVQWYHRRCAGIRATPKHKWYCKECRRYPSRSYLLHPKFLNKSLS